MKFNITFTIKGPAGIVVVPNNTNPVVCENLASLLSQLANNLPHNPYLGIETIGVRIDPLENH